MHWVAHMPINCNIVKNMFYEIKKKITWVLNACFWYALPSEPLAIITKFGADPSVGAGLLKTEPIKYYTSCFSSGKKRP